MINYLHILLNRPENGFDPVPSAHVRNYGQAQWDSGVDASLMATLEEWVGGFYGKRVLDLGAGPGHYAVAFAERGADVTWYDISMGYRNFAERKACERGLKVTYLLGYMDDALKLTGGNYDLVFNRICWYYGRSDKSFSRVVYSLTRPGGAIYIDVTHSDWRRDELSSSARFRTWLNDVLSIKIGHPAPPHKRIARLFSELPVDKMLVDYSEGSNDRLLIRRSE